MEIYAYSCIGADEQAVANSRSDIEGAGYRVSHWFADEVESASFPRTKAQQFTAMMDRLSAGDTVVVTRLRHLGSKADEIMNTIQALDALQVGIIVLELGKLSLTSDTGRMMLKMLNAVAEMEKHQPSRARGKACGRAVVLSREMRAKIITEYSQGTGVAELAHRYDVSRKRIQSVVDPQRRGDEPLPLAWGD